MASDDQITVNNNSSSKDVHVVDHLPLNHKKDEASVASNKSVASSTTDDDADERGPEDLKDGSQANRPGYSKDSAVSFCPKSIEHANKRSSSKKSNDFREKAQQQTMMNDSQQTQKQSYRSVVRGMDEAFVAVQNEHECELLAKRQWAREAALGSVIVTLSFLCCGALFFWSQTEWAIDDLALFTVYTVTSAGYGHIPIPDTALFQIVDTFYILAGLSLMAIMAAQVYQFLELEASQMQAASDKAEVLQQGLERLEQEPPSAKKDAALAKLREQQKTDGTLARKCLVHMTRLIVFSTENPWGDFLHRIGSLFGLAFIGAVIVGSIEGWRWYTAFYWAVVSLTTVGYGDVVPQTKAGKIITTIWLPLNLFFLSILFCSVGHYYLMFSAKQIERIQRQTQEKWAKEQQETERKSSSSSSSSDSSSEDDMEDVELGNNTSPERRSSSQTVPSNSRRVSRRSSTRSVESVGSVRSLDLPADARFFGSNLETMQDVFDVINERSEHFTLDNVEIGHLTDSNAVTRHGDTPNFHLRVRIKERMAYIVAEEVAGSESSLKTEDQDGMLSVHLGGTVEAADKWMIPRGARRAFRAVAFEALLVIGEMNLVRDGASVLHQLSPMEFHRIFSPLVAAMGDPDAMEGWLTSTEVLWEKEKNSYNGRRLSVRSLHAGHKNFAKSGDQVEFPTNHAEAFHLFHGV